MWAVFCGSNWLASRKTFEPSWKSLSDQRDALLKNVFIFHRPMWRSEAFEMYDSEPFRNDFLSVPINNWKWACSIRRLLCDKQQLGGKCADDTTLLVPGKPTQTYQQTFNTSVAGPKITTWSSILRQVKKSFFIGRPLAHPYRRVWEESNKWCLLSFLVSFS